MESEPAEAVQACVGIAVCGFSIFHIKEQNSVVLSRLRNRRVLINDYASEHSEDEDGSDDGIGGVQLVLPDKEERLARKASERIRSAQILGLKNVMLTESEYDAMENKRKRDELARTTGAPSSLTRERPRNSVQLIEPARFTA